VAGNRGWTSFAARQDGEFGLQAGADLSSSAVQTQPAGSVLDGWVRSDRPAEAGLHLATAGTALLVLPALGPAFDTVKLVCLLLAVVLCAWQSWNRPAPSEWVLGLVGVALLPGALAALGSGIAPDLALWGSPERSQGFVTDLALGLLLLHAAPLLNDPDRRWRWLRLVAALVILSSLLALAQQLQWTPTSLPMSEDGRSPATFGNPTQAAGWWLLAWPALPLLWWKRRTPLDAALVGAALLLLPLALWSAGSRAALPALLAGLALLLWGHRLRWPQLLVGALALVLLVLGLTLLRPDSTAVRGDLLKAGWTAISDRPLLQDAHGRVDSLHGWRWLLGYGPDGIDEVLSRSLPEGPARSARPDRVHQLWLDVYLSRGAFGVLALVGGLAWLLWRWRDPEQHGHWSARLPFVALLGWLIALQFSFPLTADKTLAVLWLAWLAAPPRGGLVDDRSSTSSALGLALLAPALLLLLQRTPPAQLMQADEAARRHYLEALAEPRPVSALRGLAEAERQFLRAERLSPYQADLALGRMTVALTIARRAQSARRALCDLEGYWLLIEADPLVAAQAGPAHELWLQLRNCPAGPTLSSQASR
jgi:hypothetical protein